MKKIPGVITRIDLNDATFSGTGCHFEPTHVNFLYGNNGTGKSTISRIIDSAPGLTFSAGKNRSDYDIHVFNQDYVDGSVVANEVGLRGIYTINKVNVEIQKQLDEKSKRIAQIDENVTALNTSYCSLEQEQQTADAKMWDRCWERTKEERTARYKDALTGFLGSKQAFAEMLLKYRPVEHDPDQLKLLYDAAYSKDRKSYSHFTHPLLTQGFEKMPGNEILGISIVNAAQTDFAKFLKKLGSTEWFRAGHKMYHEGAEGKCPYCFRDLPADFDELIEKSFDDSYEENLRLLGAFMAHYHSAAKSTVEQLAQIPREILPTLDIDLYKRKVGDLASLISDNMSIMSEKSKDPAKIVVLKETESILHEIADLIEQFNARIDENNAIVAAGSAKREECHNDVCEYLAFLLRDVIEDYNGAKSDRASKAAKIKEDTRILRSEHGQISNEMRELRAQTIETETAIHNINTQLREAGFQGFELRPHREKKENPEDGTVVYEVQRPVLSYEIVRSETGEKAEYLSEGERNFIAFLYFQQQVFGASSADGERRPKIVVIDDPASSMDSSALFIIADQVRKMVEICRNNANNREAVEEGNFIKQIFILTHNAFFHKEVTYMYLGHGLYPYVSFFKVTKRNNKSNVELCDKTNPECTSERINVNPVKNAYMALWDEYRVVKDAVEGGTSSIPLMNVVRRILEYYFVQVCGYEWNDLRRNVFEKNKGDYTRGTDAGNGLSKLELAKAMLRFIATPADPINEGLHYVDEAIDPEVLDETLQLIFKHMGQEGHYRMMMGLR